MERGDRARDHVGGGEDVQTPRHTVAALIAGSAATAAALGLTTWLALGAEPGPTARGIGAIGALGALTLAAGLALRMPAAVGACGILLGAAYALAVVADGGPLDRGAPLTAAGLLLVCELGYWSHELRTTSPDEPGALARHVAWLCILVLGTSAAGVALVVVSELARLEGVAIDVAGGVAAIAAFALLAHLAVSGGYSARRLQGAHTEAERPDEAPWRGA